LPLTSSAIARLVWRGRGVSCTMQSSWIRLEPGATKLRPRPMTYVHQSKHVVLADMIAALQRALIIRDLLPMSCTIESIRPLTAYDPSYARPNSSPVR
jgi:hypothetical protein